MPSSKARLAAAIAVWSSSSRKRSPSGAVPNPRMETSRPVRPSVRRGKADCETMVDCTSFSAPRSALVSLQRRAAYVFAVRCQREDYGSRTRLFRSYIRVAKKSGTGTRALHGLRQRGGTMLPYVTHDARFARLVFGHANLEKLTSGCRWAEGPAYFPAGRYLIWSDIPNNRMMRFDECDGSTSTFRAPAGYTNGHTVDRQGRLVSCEHLARQVTRTESDGTITVLADRYQSKRLNSPNDVVV